MNKVINKPIVSIILPVFNRSGYLNRCINSVLTQSFKNWELIAIDDGSTDDSLNILREFASKYKNIKVLTQQNMKLPLTRNRGIKESAGKYITFLDSDDMYTENHLEVRLNFMKKNKETDLIHGGIKIIGNEYVRDKNNPAEFINLSDCAIGATFFGRRKVFTTLNGFKNIPYSEDSEFLERAEKIFKIRKVDFRTYIYYRKVKDSITNSFIP